MAKGIIKRSEDFSKWYQEVVANADMAENSPTRGCMTIKPYGFAIWELLRDQMDSRIKSNGVQNAYFPMLIPLSFLAKEAEHVDGFAKETAVVTHYRLKADENKGIVTDEEAKLTEPYVIRPTSETIIGEAYSRWVKSYRDLPLKVNQWANVMRWEMRTRIFLRTSEFLWQEGHNVFATAEEANKDALDMLDMYNEFGRNVLALPTIMGEKTPEERFPGADHTYTFEGMMQDGKALQCGTSHDLGQHFSKSFDIKFLNKENNHQLAYTTSWGVSTRLMGALIMSHSDDDGLVLPPSVAPHQVVIIPVVKGDDTKEAIETACKDLENKLKEQGIRVLFDNSDYRSSDKMWNWIKKGVPVRVEIGPRDLENNSVFVARRDMGKEGKQSLSTNDFITNCKDLLNEIQTSLLEKADVRLNKNTKDISSLEELSKLFSDDFNGFANVDYKLTLSDEYEAIAEKFKLTRRCLPFKDNGEKVIIAKSY